jgi:hypothetical protein
VELEGSFDSWTQRHAMQRSGKDFTIVKLLPPGVYQVLPGAAAALHPHTPWAGTASQLPSSLVPLRFSCSPCSELDVCSHAFCPCFPHAVQVHC